MGLLKFIFGEKDREDPEHHLQSALSVVDETLRRHGTRLEDVNLAIRSFQESAKNELLQGNREGAKLALKRKKLYQEGAQMIHDQMFTLETHKEKISTMFMSKYSYDVLSQSKNQGEIEKPSMEKVELLMEDLNQQHHVADGISDLLKPREDNDNDIEDELLEIENSVAEEKSRKEATNLLQEVDTNVAQGTTGNTHAAQPVAEY